MPDPYLLNPPEAQKLRKIFRRILLQSHAHRSNLVKVFRILRETLDAEFPEDNLPTQNAFIRDCLKESEHLTTKGPPV